MILTSLLQRGVWWDRLDTAYDFHSMLPPATSFRAEGIAIACVRVALKYDKSDNKPEPRCKSL